MLTVGDLRWLLNSLPNDAPVLIEFPVMHGLLLRIRPETISDGYEETDFIEANACTTNEGRLLIYHNP